MDALCVISAPGAGAPRLNEVLEHFGDLAVFGSVFGGAGRIAERQRPLLSRLTGIDLHSLDDPEFTAFCRASPGGLMNALEVVARDGGKRLMALTLEPDPLGSDRIEQELTSRLGVRLVLLVRKQIDAYLAMFEESGIAQPPALDPDDFAKWLAAQERWYDAWRNWLNRRFLPCPVLRYETHVDLPLEGALRRVAGVAAQVGVTLRLPAPVPAGMPAEIDRRLIAERVSNWVEFSRALFERGLERRAFGYPL